MPALAFLAVAGLALIALLFVRSEEHTSELQSLRHLVCRLLLEKKKRYRLSALVVQEYAAAGFTTVVQDNIYGADVVGWLGAIRIRPVHLVVLRQSMETLSARTV